MNKPNDAKRYAAIKQAVMMSPAIECTIQSLARIVAEEWNTTPETVNDYWRSPDGDGHIWNELYNDVKTFLFHTGKLPEYASWLECPSEILMD